MPKKTDAASGRELTTADLRRLPWRSIGPAVMGGRVAALAFAPSDTKTFYVGFATGGVWKTTNLGTTFRPIFDDKETSCIGAIAVGDAPPSWGGWSAEERKKPKKDLVEAGRGKIVWIGTGEGNGRNSSSWGNGVYRSTDAGATFEHVGLAETHDIPSMAIDPRDPDVCYVAALGRLWGHNPERGLFKTTDGGKTWDPVLQIDDRTGCCEVALDPQNPDVIYAAMYQRLRTPHSFQSGGLEGGIFRSKDGGKTWEKLGGGLPSQTGRIGLAVYPKDPRILYAVVESDEGGGRDIADDRSKSGGVFRSDDGGDTWTRQSVRTPRAFYFARIYVDPANPERVYLPGWVIEVSEDGGKTFRGGVGDKIHVDHHAFLIDPDDPKHLVNGNDGGVYQSFDGGETWTFLNTMAVGQFYNVAVDMGDPYRVAGGLQDNGTWVGPSATRKETGKNRDGTLNTGITNADWEFVLWGDGFRAAFDPTDANVLYGEWQGGNLTRVDMARGTKTICTPRAKEGQPNYRFNWNSPFFVSPHDPQVLYHGGNVVFRFTERGDKWEIVSPDLTTADGRKILTAGSTAENYCTLTALAESPLEAGLLWAGSDDGLVHVRLGGEWKNVTPKEADGLYVSEVEPGHHDKGRALVSVDGHRSNVFKPLILLTEDFGASWQDATGDLPSDTVVKVVREDLTNPDVLYCGTEHGAFVSIDRGKRWIRMNGKALPTVPIDDIVQHPRELDLVLGTHGRSIWVLDDASVFGQLTPAVLASAFHLFPVRPAKRYWRRHYGGLWTDQLWRAANPPFGARFDYWIGEYQDEEVAFVIEDAHGKEVAKMTGPNAPGLNRAVWDLQPHEWRRLPDRGEDLHEPFYALPGSYRVKIKYGKHKAEAAFEVVDAPVAR
jgi:photosystem II stability/assembly factor-like uncharacterized protein